MILEDAARFLSQEEQDEGEPPPFIDTEQVTGAVSPRIVEA